jgi:hypothetical protein
MVATKDVMAKNGVLIIPKGQTMMCTGQKILERLK